jgi:hypothetical protein
MSTPTVQSGLYRFFSKVQLDQERLRYVEQVRAANTNLSSASVNGQSFTFAVGGRELTLEQWGDTLADAYNQLGIYDYGAPTPRTLSSRF